MNRKPLRMALATASLALGACAQPPLAPPYRAQEFASGQRHYALALGQTVIEPALLAGPAPIYPSAWASRGWRDGQILTGCLRRDGHAACGR